MCAGIICTNILHTAMHYNIGGNIGNGLNFVTYEQGLTVFYHSNGRVLSLFTTQSPVNPVSGLAAKTPGP